MENLLIKRTEVIGIILKERALAVGRLDGIPMYVTPIAMVADADIAHQAFFASVAFGRDGKRERPLCCSYHTTVAIGLLYIMLPLLDACLFSSIELCIIRYGSQVGGGEMVHGC